MEIKQNPFSLYDFLGYFVPGAVFIFGLASKPFSSNASQSIMDNMISTLQLDNPSAYFPFVLISYFIGHILSFISSVTLENYSRWKFGYPSKFLLGAPYPGYFKPDEDKLVPNKQTIRFLVALFLFPITIWDIFLGDILHLKKLLTARPADEPLIELINRRLAKLADLCTESKTKKRKLDGSELFMFAYHYAVEKSTNHLPKMQNYVALYGFTRTMTMVVVLWFWLVVLFPKILPFSVGNVPVTPLIFSIIAYISFLNFMKFYRRFSLEVLMAIAVTV